MRAEREERHGESVGCALLLRGQFGQGTGGVLEGARRHYECRHQLPVLAIGHCALDAFTNDDQPSPGSVVFAQWSNKDAALRSKLQVGLNVLSAAIHSFHRQRPCSACIYIYVCMFAFIQVPTCNVQVTRDLL